MCGVGAGPLRSGGQRGAYRGLVAPPPARQHQRQQRTRQSPDRLAGALRLRRVGGYATATTDNTARTGARSMSHAISAALSSDVASTGRDSAQSARKVMTVVSTFTPAF